MTSRRDSPGRMTMPGLPADSGVSFGSEVLGAYMRMGLSNSCTSRPALYTERVSEAEARTRTRSGVNRKSSALIETVCIDPSHARRVATTRPRVTVLPFTEMSRVILFAIICVGLIATIVQPTSIFLTDHEFFDRRACAP